MSKSVLFCLGMIAAVLYGTGQLSAGHHPLGWSDRILARHHCAAEGWGDAACVR